MLSAEPQYKTPTSKKPWEFSKQLCDPRLSLPRVSALCAESCISPAQATSEGFSLAKPGTTFGGGGDSPMFLGRK